MKIPITIIGFAARIISAFIPVQKKHWVFGADYGNMYREGPKYLLEYMIRHHTDYKCTFITRNKDVKKSLDAKNIPCLLNYSLAGIIQIAKAEAVFISQVMSDVQFAYKKKGRKHYYLVHGQPLKLALFAASDTYLKKINRDYNFLNVLWKKICNFLSVGVDLQDCSFVSASSDFLKQYMEKDFGFKVPVKVLGMPRNDALFDVERMLNEKWINGLEGKFVVTYMPTHRAYGQGDVTPTPFINKPEYQQWMKENNVVFLMKNHPNMIPKLKNAPNTDVIKDITKDRLDPQVCLYHTDVLVTDFSSVWMDFLMLKRPVIFYIYDNFEQEDAGAHYDIREDPPGHFCYDEEAFFNLIKKAREKYDCMKPSQHIIEKYHKYPDGNSCERYYKAVVSDIKQNEY